MQIHCWLLCHISFIRRRRRSSCLPRQNLWCVETLMARLVQYLILICCLHEALTACSVLDYVIGSSLQILPILFFTHIWESDYRHTLLVKKRVVTPTFKTIKPMWIELLCSTWLKLAWYGPVIDPQRNPTLPWVDIQCKVKWDCRAPKPQYRWSFPQINLHIVTTLNQYLHFFSKVFSDCSNNAPSNPYGY